jgi:hypothetical protein
MWFCNWSDKGTASNVVQISEKVQRRPWQWLDKHSGKKAWAVHGKSKLTETEEGEAGEELSQELAHHFLWHQGDCSQRIRPGRPNSIPHCTVTFTKTLWKWAKTSPQTLSTKELVLLSQQCSDWHFLFQQGRFDQEQHDCCPPPTLHFSVSLTEDKTERLPFWHNWGYLSTIAGCAEHPGRTRLPGCIWKVSEALEWCIFAKGDYFSRGQ